MNLNLLAKKCRRAFFQFKIKNKLKEHQFLSMQIDSKEIFDNTNKFEASKEILLCILTKYSALYFNAVCMKQKIIYKKIINTMCIVLSKL